MVFDFLISIETKSLLSTSLQTLVDEVCSLIRPSCGDLVLFYLSLLRYNMLSDFPSSLAEIRSAAEHALPCYDTDCKVISGYAMVPFAHDLRCHVSWSPRSLI